MLFPLIGLIPVISDKQVTCMILFSCCCFIHIILRNCNIYIPASTYNFDSFMIWYNRLLSLV